LITIPAKSAEPIPLDWEARHTPGADICPYPKCMYLSEMGVYEPIRAMPF